MVVPCRDRAGPLAAALAALRAGGARPGEDVVVADSASRDDSVAAAAHAGGARLVRLTEPGASRARDAGWRAVAAQVVAFTDDDCRAQPGWTAGLAAAFADPRVGFAFGRVEPDGRGHPVSVLLAEAAYDVAGPFPLGRLGHGANLAVRRCALEQVGGFDPLLGAGAPVPAAEDKDLMLRLLRAGWRGRYLPAAVVAHAGRPTRAAALRAEWAYGRGEGALLAKARRLRPAPPAVPAAAVAHLRSGARDLTRGYALGALAGPVRAAGVLAGALAVRRRRLDGHGRFR